MAIYSDISSLGSNKITDIASVKQSIENILFTRQGERLFRPKFGASIEDFLFELDEADLDILVAYNLTCAFRADPRVIFEANATLIERDEQDPNKIEITLTCSIDGLQDSQFTYVAVVTR